jgi:hypothetical protein
MNIHAQEYLFTWSSHLLYVVQIHGQVRVHDMCVYTPGAHTYRYNVPLIQGSQKSASNTISLLGRIIFTVFHC